MIRMSIALPCCSWTPSNDWNFCLQTPSRYGQWLVLLKYSPAIIIKSLFFSFFFCAELEILNFLFHRLMEEPAAYGKLGLANLLELREECLREFQFTDAYRSIKQRYLLSYFNYSPPLYLWCTLPVLKQVQHFPWLDVLLYATYLFGLWFLSFSLLMVTFSHLDHMGLLNMRTNLLWWLWYTYLREESVSCGWVPIYLFKRVSSKILSLFSGFMFINSSDFGGRINGSRGVDIT